MKQFRVNNISRGELLAVAIGYLFATVLFLWFAVRPKEFSTNLQGLDSVLMAGIAGHVYNVIFGGAGNFWDFPIFYPTKNALCLSEPMILMAIVTAPIIKVFGLVAASNFYMYLSWWTLAISMWWYLRQRQVDTRAAFWGGLFVSFNPFRAYHAIGHDHLYFQAGFLLALTCLHRALLDGGLRWRILYCIGIVSQLLAGFHLCVIMVLWGAIVVPVEVYIGARREGCLHWKRCFRAGLFAVAIPAAAVIFYLPILQGYMDFGKDRVHAPLENLVAESATIQGYLLPPAIPDRLETLPARLLPSGLGHDLESESSRYLGLPALVLLCYGIGIVAMKYKKCNVSSSLYLGAVAAAGLLCLILSFGPTWNRASIPSAIMPFGYLYAWLEPLRFIRSPSRFQFGVHWSIAILGAFALSHIFRYLLARQRKGLSYLVNIGLIAFTIFEFLPINHFTRINVQPTELTRWLRDQRNSKPFIDMSMDLSNTMGQFSLHNLAIGNGYSGYSPDNRTAEFQILRNNFPDDATLAILGDWKIERVLADAKAIKKLSASDNVDKFRSVWSGSDGTLLELTTAPLALSDYRELRVQHLPDIAGIAYKPITLITDNFLTSASVANGIEMHTPDIVRSRDGELSYANQFAHVEIEMTSGSLVPAQYRSMKIRYRVANWYELKERGLLVWNTECDRGFNDRQKFEFVINADGHMHEIELPLGQSVAWVSSPPIRSLHIRLGSRFHNKLKLKMLSLE